MTCEGVGAEPTSPIPHGSAPPEPRCRPDAAGLSLCDEKFLVMRHLLFWAAVTAIIGAIVAIQFEFEYVAALQRTAELQIGS